MVGETHQGRADGRGQGNAEWHAILVDSILAATIVYSSKQSSSKAEFTRAWKVISDLAAEGSGSVKTGADISKILKRELTGSAALGWFSSVMSINQCLPSLKDAVPRCPVQGHSAQQARSNSALRTRTNHHTLARLLCCNALLRGGSWWALWWGSLDGMQGVRGSNPLSSTRHNASAALPLRVVCQQIVSRSLNVTSVAL
jgi:hypothetical protein